MLLYYAVLLKVAKLTDDIKWGLTTFQKFDLQDEESELLEMERIIKKEEPRREDMNDYWI